jgi:hypothetical protein
MTTNGDRSAIESAVPIPVSLPGPPAAVDMGPVASGSSSKRMRDRGRIASLAVVAATGMAIGLGLGAAVATTVPPATQARDARSPLAATSSWGSEPGGSERAERVIAAVLAAAPRCTPEIRMAGAPAAERTEFLDEARRFAAEASERGLRSVRWKVIERHGRLFGVLYGERCE